MIRRMKKHVVGFTLVEVLVVTLIFAVVASAVSAMAVVGQRYWEVNQARVELQQELRKAISWMINDLRQAGNSSITNVPADGSWYNTITFKTPAGVTAGSLTWNANTIQFVRGGTGSKQLQRISGGVTKILAQDMQTLQFRRLSTAPNELQVAMTARRSDVRGGPVNYQLNSTIQLRNN